MKGLAALIACLFWGGAALAQGVSLSGGMFPALYDVAGVAANDTLNVRAGPSGAREVLATLAPNARGIEVVGLSDDGRWGIVSLDDSTNGWASMHYLRREPGQDAATVPLPLACSGTEPFWGFQLGADGAGTGDIDGVTHALRTGWRATALNTGPAYGLRLEMVDGKPGEKPGENPGTLRAVVTRALCDDGMSETLYGFRIYALLSGAWGDRILAGCCRLTGGAQ